MRLGPRLRQTIRDITRASSPPDIGEALVQLGQPVGLTRVFLAEVVLGPARPELVVYIDTMGDDWRRLTAQHLGADIDATVDLLRGQSAPQTWSELARQRLTPHQKAFIEALRARGYCDGVSAPIRGPNGHWAWAGSASDHEVTLADSERLSIQTVALLALTRCRQLRLATRSKEEALRALTEREAEILYWVLEGKTDDEIGIIIGLGRTTVKFHLRNAVEKLNASNRTTASMRALKAGLLLGPLTRHAVLVDESRRR